MLTKIEEICSKLREEIQDRLLSEDLITDAIITFYFNIVKCLNIIDKEMLHYQEVVGPIRQYLTKRPDIIKAVISIWKDTLSNSSGDSETYRVLDVAPHQSHGLESDDDEAEADKWDVRNIEGPHDGLRKSKLQVTQQISSTKMWTNSVYCSKCLAQMQTLSKSMKIS